MREDVTYVTSSLIGLDLADIYNIFSHWLRPCWEIENRPRLQQASWVNPSPVCCQGFAAVGNFGVSGSSGVNGDNGEGATLLRSSRISLLSGSSTSSSSSWKKNQIIFNILNQYQIFWNIYAIFIEEHRWSNVNPFSKRELITVNWVLVQLSHNIILLKCKKNKYPIVHRCERDTSVVEDLSLVNIRPDLDGLGQDCSTV